LYRHVEAGQTIPVDLYAAVAAILAYLYRQQVEERIRRERAREQDVASVIPSLAVTSQKEKP
jgi:flagellar biosynthesis protein FlhB